MKSKIHILLYFVAVLLFGACEPQEFDKPEIGGVAISDQIKFTIAPGDDEFHFVLENTSDLGGIAKWDLGNGTSASGNKIIAYYPAKGTFTVTLSLATRNGIAANINTITQENVDFEFFSAPIFTYITGGQESPDGKTWVIDSLYVGHFGVGPAGGVTPEWWKAKALDKTGAGAYDDEFTFNLSGFTLDFMNNGNSFVAGGRKGDASYTVLEEIGAEALVAFEPAAGNWAVATEGTTQYLTLSSKKPIFFAFDFGAVGNKYRIEEVTEFTLRLSCVGADGNRWYMALIKKGYIPDAEPEPEAKVLKELDLADSFEGAGNISWSTGAIEGFETMSNPFSGGVNTSANVLKYSKAGGEWSNASITLDYLLDLKNRNVFTMKVYMPSTNDYTTECNPGTDWMDTHNLQAKIDVKLQNSLLGGDSYTTQEVRGHILETNQLDGWVELKFDFSDVADREDFDVIIVQFGNEGHCNPGVFYFDDFKLTAAESKTLKALDLNDNFDGNANIAWSTGQIDGFETVANPFSGGINTSANVLKYTKGSGEWSNASIVLDYILDLKSRSVFKMKVYMPSTNDYVTECNPGTDWIPTHSLIPQIDIKLQNSLLGGEAYSTQKVKGHILETTQLDGWVELTFDFSEFSDREDFDQIVIQFGMEGHCNPGVFYFDDFMLQ